MQEWGLHLVELFLNFSHLFVHFIVELLLLELKSVNSSPSELEWLFGYFDFLIDALEQFLVSIRGLGVEIVKLILIFEFLRLFLL